MLLEETSLLLKVAKTRVHQNYIKDIPEMLKQFQISKVAFEVIEDFCK